MTDSWSLSDGQTLISLKSQRKRRKVYCRKDTFKRCLKLPKFGNSHKFADSRGSASFKKKNSERTMLEHIIIKLLKTNSKEKNK